MNHLKEMEKLIRSLSPRHHTRQAFSDFVEMAACAISNTVDPQFKKEREKRYMDIVRKYDKEGVEVFPKLLGHLTMALEEGFDDVLGKLYSSLEIHNAHAGQFFTPYEVSRMMAKMTLADGHGKEIIDEKGFIRASEPACGAGGLVIALAEALKEDGINYQQHLHITAVDVDLTAALMAYVQLSLLHIPAVVVHGDTLRMEEFSHWYTPAHIMGLWDYKLRREERGESKPKEPVEESSREEQPTPQVTEAQPAEKVQRERQLSLF
jgi:type I restriction-modification system DNA methylase subunit